MPKLHVAFRTDAGGPGMKAASNSNTTLRKRLATVPGSYWSIFHYNVKADVGTICQLIEDITQVPFESSENVRVNESGQVRKVE